MSLANTTVKDRAKDTIARSPFVRWLLAGYLPEPEAPYAHGEEGVGKTHHRTHSWWEVVCLTGVDYFSTLGYQPGIAALAAGALSPMATLVLVLLTLFGAFPIYSRVAEESPHGEGSIAMLEGLLKWWQGKLFVLALLGFVATDFVITITLSAADATAHVVENPFLMHYAEGHEVAITLLLVGALSAVFLKGFKEAVGIAVVLVIIYLGLNAVVVGRGLIEVFAASGTPSPGTGLGAWITRLSEPKWGGGNPLMMVAISLLVFPKLALGLSGFETGVAVMPMVKGDPSDTEANPAGRIKNTRKLLLTAALIMSVYLIASSIITTVLIPEGAFSAARVDEKGAELQGKGEANGRALAYLAYQFFGNAFGTVYDASTIAILWFAGASAMAGLLNIVPRYLPRYGMAPEWTRANRPLVLIFTAIAFVVTIAFKADVDAQGGAYATGVLVLMTSAAVAVTIAAARKKEPMIRRLFFGFVSLVFAYTTGVNVYERPDGVKIASFFIFSIIAVSLLSRVFRSLELRAGTILVDDAAKRILTMAMRQKEMIRVVPNAPETRDAREYEREERDARHDHGLSPDAPILFMEIYVRDASEFEGDTRIRGVEISGYRVLRVDATAIPNGIAATLLYIRDATGKTPHAYFNWGEGSPLLFALRYLLTGSGDIAPVTREVLRIAEPELKRRPVIHAAM
ncbi:MAG: APC family permease [Armatimonadetes bacterium]|nr:APC family permease [Armatimonadota bacterium]